MNSPNVVTSMLQVFSINVYELLHTGTTLFFFTAFVYMMFEIILDVLNETYLVSTLVSDSVVESRVYRSCPISLYHKLTLVDFVELEMLDFDVILGIDLLNARYSSTDYHTRIVKFKFPKILL